MERLTERLANNEMIVRCNGTYGDTMRKLADYEDAEEQGRLFIAPCKSGDYIYIVDKDLKAICPIKCKYFSFGDGIAEYLVLADDYDFHDPTEEIICYSMEEAKAKLSELEAEKYGQTDTTGN